HLAHGDGVRRDAHVVAGIGLDPEADFLVTRLVEGDVNGNGLDAGETAGVHGGGNGRLLAGPQVSLEGGRADAAAGDADAGDVDGGPGVVGDAIGVFQGRAAG